MKTSVATLPPGAHVSVIRSALEGERGMRMRVLRGADKASKIAEIDRALESLEAIEAALREKAGAA